MCDYAGARRTTNRVTVFRCKRFNVLWGPHCISIYLSPDRFIRVRLVAFRCARCAERGDTLCGRRAQGAAALVCSKQLSRMHAACGRHCVYVIVNIINCINAHNSKQQRRRACAFALCV